MSSVLLGVQGPRLDARFGWPVLLVPGLADDASPEVVVGVGSEGHARVEIYAAVEDAVCQLREFPRSNHVVAHDTTALAAEACTGRQGESLAASAFATADRCAATYLWWGDPYVRTSCTTDPTLVQNPGGYLLPYWMARYAGFVAAAQ